MLLAGLKREHEPPPAVDVAGLPCDAAGHQTHQGLAGGEEAERRTAEVEPVAERLPLTHHDVHATLAWRLQQSERQRVAGADRQRPHLFGRTRELLQVFHRAQEVRLLDHHGAHALIELRQLRQAIRQRHLDHLDAVSVGQGLERLARMGVDPARHDEPLPAVGQLGHVASGSHRARAFVHGGVCDWEACQLTDRRLVLEHRLQSTLRDLGLVRGVGSEELGALDDRVDQRRHIVVVHARAEERQLVLGRGVPRRQSAELVVHLLLGATAAERAVPIESQRRGDVGEQLLDRRDPDRLEHLAPVGVGGGDVGAH